VTRELLQGKAGLLFDQLELGEQLFGVHWWLQLLLNLEPA
jgi:hypothetical protein